MSFERITDRKRLAFILDRLGVSLPSGARVLDLGCGNGIITEALGKAGFQVTGLEPSSEAIRRARHEHGHENVEYLQGELGDQTFPTRGFDAIVCSEVLEHVPDPIALLNQMQPLIRPGGRLILTVPNGRGPRELLVTRPVQALICNPVGKRLISWSKKLLGYSGTTVQSDAEDLTHLHFFTVSRLRRMAASTGFHVEEIVAANFLEQVFPFSLLTRRSIFLQKLDCRIADHLPLALSSGFMMVWSPTP